MNLKKNQILMKTKTTPKKKKNIKMPPKNEPEYLKNKVKKLKIRYHIKLLIIITLNN
jgi:hypothetical protein